MSLRVALAVVVVLVAALPGPVQAQAAPTGGEWVSLGPGGPWRASEVAVSSGWPADPFIVARLEPSGPSSSGPPRPPTPSDLPRGARSTDGGRTWQPLPALPAGTLRVVQTERAGRVLLAFDRDATEEGGSGRQVVKIHRSTDDGDTWQTVTSLPRELGRWSVAASPTVREDSRLLVLTAGQLFDSQDAGATWQQIEAAPGQRISAAVFSPDVAHDRSIYLSAVTSRHYLRPRPDDDPIYAAATESAGVVVSRDGGASWSSLSAGLQAEGRPYRHVEELAISPTFARDGTLFAFAWGPWPRHTQGSYDYVSPYMGLFRSRDGGESWELVWAPPNGGLGGMVSRSLTISISPRFADDGVVMASMNMSGPSAASTSCDWLRSADAGATWVLKSGPAYGGCSRIEMVTDPSPVFIWSSSSQGARTWSVSHDLGATSASFDLPGWVGGEERSSSLTLAPDGTFLMASAAGVWALGPSAVATGGRFPCSADEPSAFAAIRLAAGAAGPWLGCPLGPPSAVKLREQRLGNVRALWIEDASSEWFELSTPPRQRPRLARHAKESEPWTGPPDRVLDAELLSYQGGIVLRSDGAGLAYVLADPHWQEVTGP